MGSAWVLDVQVVHLVAVAAAGADEAVGDSGTHWGGARHRSAVTPAHRRADLDKGRPPPLPPPVPDERR